LNFNIQVRRAAELDLAEAEIWYENQRPGLGAEFLSEISRIFTVLGQTPLLYPVLHRECGERLSTGFHIYLVPCHESERNGFGVYARSARP
jgi:hypothetical protein